ncbi:MAG: DUF2283 domain-containing protein [Planctomycetes bacterium]|nr:DUF2283 domain-containing protein [Planctomycetota bacterium]
MIRRADIAAILRAVPSLVDLPGRRFQVDFDDEADVLYLSFRRPQKATASKLLDNGVIVHRPGEEIVGLTILEASKR